MSNQTSDIAHQASNTGSTKVSPGSVIAVTGAAGFLGSAVVEQLISQGFVVRATTTTASKMEELNKKIEAQFGPGRLDIVEIKDLSVEGALDGVLRDVSGVISLASDVSFSDDLHATVKGVIALTEEVLKSIQKTPSVKSMVSCSSRVAAFEPNGTSQSINDKDWFTQASNLAQKEVDDTKKRGLIYSASKVAGEKALWEFKEKEHPSFRISAILPDLVLGQCHNPADANYSTYTGLLQFSKNEPGLMDHFFQNPCWFVNVDDVAKLHVAALLDEEVDGQRLWAAAGPFCAEDVQNVLKEVKPDYNQKDLSSFPKKPDVKIDNKASVDLLQKHYSCGFTGLKETVRANVC